jgi:hypothetical protein
LEKEVLRWWKGSMAEGGGGGGGVGMDLDADARAVRSGGAGEGMQVKRVGFGCERKRKSVGFQRGNGLLSYCFPPEIWILCAAPLCFPLPEPEAHHNLLT